MHSADQQTAIVIGAGIIGVCAALELNRRGYRVTLVEPASPGGSQGASYGNGAMLSTASTIPLSMPGIWKNVPGYLLARRGPLVIRWRDLPHLTPWLCKFLLAGSTRAKMRRISDTLAALLRKGPEQHIALAEAAGADALIRQDGIIYAWHSRADFDKEAHLWALRLEQGIDWQPLEEAELRRLEPNLAEEYRFGVIVASAGRCLDPGRYVAALAALLKARGGEVVTARVDNLRLSDGAITGVTLGAGNTKAAPAAPRELQAKLVVVAAGVASRTFAAQAGEDVPLIAERGYHVEFDPRAHGPAHAMMPMDGRMSIATLQTGVRASGQVELARSDAPPNWSRAEILKAHMLRCFPSINPNQSPRFWMGCRPSLPDCMPVISLSARINGLSYAFGHGHIGLSSGPETARRLADLIETGHCIDMEQLSITRFAR